jgi:hypothetical protein
MGATRGAPPASFRVRAYSMLPNAPRGARRPGFDQIARSAVHPGPVTRARVNPVAPAAARTGAHNRNARLEDHARPAGRRDMQTKSAAACAAADAGLAVSSG